MKKILIFLISFLIILTGCSKLIENPDELVKETKRIAESYGLDNVEVECKNCENKKIYKDKSLNPHMIIKTRDFINIKSKKGITRENGYTLEEIRENDDFAFFMEEEIQSLSDELSNTIIISKNKNTSPFVINLDRRKVYYNGGASEWSKAKSKKFKVEEYKPKKPKKNKDDWYEEHPDDDDWKDVVDGLTELYGDDD